MHSYTGVLQIMAWAKWGRSVGEAPMPYEGKGRLQDQGPLFPPLSVRQRRGTAPWSAHMFQATDRKQFTQALIE